MILIYETFIIFNLMSKGLLMVAVLSAESKYYGDRDYRILIKSGDASFIHFVAKGNTSPTFGKNYQLFPLANDLEVRLFENDKTDTRQGYFKIPMAKLIELPKKNHLISVRCVWV